MTAQNKPGPGRPVDHDLRAEREEQILAAATKSFAELGFDRTDLQDVANLIGVGKGTLYRYFPTKEELFLAAVNRVMDLLGESIQAEATAEDPLDQLSEAVRAYLRFFAKHTDFVELIILERACFKDRAIPTYHKHLEIAMARWRELFSRLIDDGRLRSVPPERITDVLSGAVFGAMFSNYLASERRPLEDQADSILDIVLNGIVTLGDTQRTDIKDEGCS